MPNYNLGSVEGEIQIAYNGAGVQQARGDVEQLLRTVSGQELLVRIGGNIGDLTNALDVARGELARLESLPATVEVEADIARARANIDTLESEIRRIGDVEIEVDADTSRAESRFGDLGDRAKVAGVAAGGFFAVALNGAMERQDMTTAFQAQMALTPEAAKKYGDLAGSIYASGFGDSIGDVNEAFKSIQTNIDDLGNLSDAEITSISQSALGLASTFNVDVNDATRAAGQLMKTGLAPDAKTAFDIIATGFQTGANGSDDLLDTINEYSVQFQKLGIDGPTAMNLISQGLQGGARDGDLVADAFKELSLRVIDGSKSTADGFKTIGLNSDEMAKRFSAGGTIAKGALEETLNALNNMKDPVAKNAAGVALFGTQWEDLGGAMNSINLDEASVGMASTAGNMDKINAAMGSTAQANIETTKRGLENFMNQLITMDGPIGDVAAGVAAMGPDMLTMGAAVVTAAATAGPALIPLVAGLWGYIWAGITAVASTIASWATIVATSVASAAVVAAAWLAANPIALIIIALAAIVALVVYYWDEIVAFLAMVWEGIKTGLAAFGAALYAIFIQPFIDIWNWITSWFGDIGGAFDFGLGSISEQWTAAWQAISDFVSGIFEWIKGFILDSLSWLIDTNDGSLLSISDIWNNVFGGIKDFIINTFNWVLGFFGTSMDQLSNSTSEGINNVVQWFRDLPGNIVRAVGNLGMLLYNAGRDVVMGIWNGIMGMGSWLSDSLWGWVRSVIPGPVQQALGIASPSKLMEDEVGKMIPAGIMVGMEASSGSMIASAKAMTEELSAAAAAGIDMGQLALAGQMAAPDLAPMNAALTAGVGNMGTRSLNVGALTLQVTGNLDPTNPVQWRSAVESLRDELTSVEASYR
jgi:phage-related minor tail protein